MLIKTSSSAVKPWHIHFLSIASELTELDLKAGRNIKCPIHQGSGLNCQVEEDHFYCHSRCGYLEAPKLFTELGLGSFYDFKKRFGYLSEKPESAEEIKQRIQRRVKLAIIHREEENKSLKLCQIAKKLREEAIFTYRDDNYVTTLWEESPVSLDDPFLYAWNTLITLFQPDDTIWLGQDVYHQGAKVVTLAELEKEMRELNYQLPYERFCGAILKPDAEKRNSEAILKEPFILLEWDDLAPDPEENKIQSVAIIRKLQEVTNMKLLSVTDTGNKSIHSLWLKPDEDDLDLLKRTAGMEGLGFDPDCLEPNCRPLRLHGATHPKTNGKAKLLYLANPNQKNHVA